VLLVSISAFPFRGVPGAASRLAFLRRRSFGRGAVFNTTKNNNTTAYYADLERAMDGDLDLSSRRRRSAGPRRLALWVRRHDQSSGNHWLRVRLQWQRQRSNRNANRSSWSLPAVRSDPSAGPGECLARGLPVAGGAHN